MPRPRLFPEYDIETLELLYMDCMGALHVAASEATMSDDGAVISKQISEWNQEGHRIALIANTIRMKKNMRMRPQ